MPRYDYRCGVCGEVEEITHGFHDDEDVRCVGCGTSMGKVIANVNVAPSVTPSRSGGIDMEATKKAEVEKDRDMAAYKRLRKDGVQPPAINGSAKLEAKAENSYEVNSGHTFKSESARRRSMSLVKDVVDNQ
jgi:putative FmdB family regulatory protein